MESNKKTMDQQKILELLIETASEIPEQSMRMMFLDWACRGDHALREKIEKLLSINESATKFFDFQPLEAAGEEDTAEENPDKDAKGGIGLRIGRYRLIHRLGEGGCGVVYQAEQETPVKRQVALKLIRIGLNHGEVIARFEAERQALAMMDHPGIARVLDAGATAEGRPYFVMEWVTGEKITKFCDLQRLKVTDILRLFIRVCHAIQHAHQKGIIHRELKPSNILTSFHDGIPLPKVIDFGIAKATGANEYGFSETLADQDLMLGTPNYMSPEQRSNGGMDVDTRTDLYSLGVLLCEILTGKTPFGAGEEDRINTSENRGIFKERNPLPPSKILNGYSEEELSVIEENRSCKRGELQRMLRGDLDAIVMKCLQSDRQLRYGTANDLALDIQRYLDFEPVVAMPDSEFYRLRRLMKRNKLAFITSGVIFVALTVGFGTSTWLFLREKEAKREQSRLRNIAEITRAEAERSREMEVQLRARAEAREKVAQAAVWISHGNLEMADKLLSTIPDALTPSSLEAAQSYRAVGDWHALGRRWPQAARCFSLLASSSSSVDTSDSADISIHILPAAAAACEAYNWELYERVRQQAIARFSGTKNSVVAEQILKVSLLRPANEATLQLLSPLAVVLEDSLSPDPKTAPGWVHLRGWGCFALTLWNYRRGDFEQARHWAKITLDVDDLHPVRIPMTLLIFAMSEFRLGNFAEARVILDKASIPIIRIREKPVESWVSPNGVWSDWSHANILMEEARAMINP